MFQKGDQVKLISIPDDGSYKFLNGYLGTRWEYVMQYSGVDKSCHGMHIISPISQIPYIESTTYMSVGTILVDSSMIEKIA